MEELQKFQDEEDERSDQFLVVYGIWIEGAEQIWLGMEFQTSGAKNLKVLHPYPAIPDL